MVFTFEQKVLTRMVHENIVMYVKINPLLYLICACLVCPLCVAVCDPVDCSPPGSSDHGILQARRLDWVAMPSSRGSSQPRDRSQISSIADGFFTIWAPREAQEYWSG